VSFADGGPVKRPAVARYSSGFLRCVVAVLSAGDAQDRQTQSSSVNAPSVPPETAVEQAETRGGRVRRYTRRTWLYTWASVSIVVFVLIVILIAQNTRSVKVGWIFGHSHISLVILIVFSSVLGWILGIATGVIFRRRTRRPG
jgi:uncharacterized integral membrane protein